MYKNKPNYSTPWIVHGNHVINQVKIYSTLYYESLLFCILYIGLIDYLLWCIFSISLHILFFFNMITGVLVKLLQETIFKILDECTMNIYNMNIFQNIFQVLKRSLEDIRLYKIYE